MVSSTDYDVGNGCADTNERVGQADAVWQNSSIDGLFGRMQFMQEGFG